MENIYQVNILIKNEGISRVFPCTLQSNKNVYLIQYRVVLEIFLKCISVV